VKLGKSALRRVRTALEHEHLGTGLVALAIWFAFAVRPMPDTSTDIDPSWQRVLDLAYSRGDRAGVDYVFPFGPLGALGGWIELPHVYWLRWLGFDGLLFALASWFGARALRGGGWPAIALTLVALNVFPPIGDSRALLAMAYIAAGLVVRRRTASVELVLGLLALVAFGLVKF
jgi:hypothetical protein